MLKVILLEVADRLRVIDTRLENLENQKQDIKKSIEVKHTQTETSKLDAKVVNPTGSVKTFVLKHVFKNVSAMKDSEEKSSDDVEHFGIPWNILILRNEGKLHFELSCVIPTRIKDTTFEIDCEIHVLHPTRSPVHKTFNSHCKNRLIDDWKPLMEWEEIEKDYLFNDELTVEIRARINETTGIYADDLRHFDDEECSDVVLIANDRKFFVSKLYLATHSSYFKSMFLGRFDEARLIEILLPGVDAADLQKYLEALYGESVIDERTVEGILLLADMYDTEILIKKCEEFLLKESKKALKKKLEMSVRFNLFELKNKCSSEIKTLSDIRSALPNYIDDMDPSLMAVLFKKTLSLV